MVKKHNLRKGIIFSCEECNMAYAKEKIAKQCENWCRTHHSCNIDLMKHALYLMENYLMEK